MLRNYASFNGEELSTPRPTFKLEDHASSAVRDCLFHIFAATLHFLRQQPEDAPCRVDRDSLVMIPINESIKFRTFYTFSEPLSLHALHYVDACRNSYVKRKSILLEITFPKLCNRNYIR